ncbi:MAG: PQQ-binding-like beta-propeller repeat protein [Candidatus Bathyarchaeota archaeon]|nr:PQQ-binding-like beta-propeller repeat protein [Candidatus Bathyarchaeota archaeon]
MKLPKSKTIITLFLLSTFAIALAALPIANAHTPPWIIPTWTYVSVTNNPIGVNQPLGIFAWSDKYPMTAVGGYGDRFTFYLDITGPDGSKETIGPLKSDPIGTVFYTYTPNQVGTYTIVARMLNCTLTGQPLPPGTSGLYRGVDYVNDTYLGSTSDSLEVIVQQEPIKAWQETPLPTEYWTRPINSMNRLWSALAGNWLYSGFMTDGPTTNVNAYCTGPESPHVMWSRPMWAGGVMDGRFGDLGYQTSHYSGLSFTPIILNGKIYYNVGSHPREGWYCLDLYTGKVEYFHNTTGAVSGVQGTQEQSGAQFDPEGSITGESLLYGQIYNYDSPNQHGGFPYLWCSGQGIIGYTQVPGVGQTAIYGTVWMMFDAYSGNYICSIANTTQTERRGTRTITTGATGTQVYGKDGSILYYNVVNLGTTTPAYYLQVWNNTYVIWYRKVWNTNQYWMWRPYLNYTFGGQYGFSLNASIPAVQGSILAVRENQYIIGGTAGSNNENGITQGNLWALNLKPDANGAITPTLLWNITFTPPSSAGNKTITMGRVDPEDGVFVFYCTQTRQWWGYSLETGQQIWGPTEPEYAQNMYGMSSNIYRGLLLSYGSGQTGTELVAYDIKTGKVAWRYTPAQEGFESPYGNYPLSLACIADGKLYFYSTEHSPTQPLWRGSYLRCINASDGAELWKISHWGAVVVADGYLVGWNAYDNMIYCYGKGPSATTIAASPKVSVHGNSVLVEGTVTDISAGTEQFVQSKRFPNGVPAVSDEDQRAWMEYVYMQQACPTSAKGVDVTLDALDPNGNFVHIGTVTSDMAGTFAKAFTPEVPGLYQIIATFAGSKSYYGSYAETYVQVDEAPPASPSPEYPQPIDPTMTIVAVGIAIILVVIIFGILLLRKK